MKKKREPLPLLAERLPGGERISYKKVGEGPNLLVVPGLFQNLDGSDSLAQTLANDGFTVYVVAFPGGDGSTPLRNYSIESVRQWWESVLQVLELEEELVLVTKSLGIALIGPYLHYAYRRGNIRVLFAQEPVTSLADTSLAWQGLYRAVKTLRLLGLGFAAIGLLWFVRESLAAGRVRFAIDLRKTSLIALSRVGDLVSDRTVTNMMERASKRMELVTFTGNNHRLKDKLILRKSSVFALVKRLRKVAHHELEGAGHFLGWKHQVEMGKRIVEIGREKGLLSKEK